MNFKIEHYVITGASRGLGLGFAALLVKKGHRVTALVRNPSDSENLNRLQKAHPEQLTVIKADVTSRESVTEASNHISTPIDVLINNSGVFLEQEKSFLETDEESLRDTFNVNLFGVFRVTQALLPLLRKASMPKIINISSGLGRFDSSFNGSYAYLISKTALNRLTSLLAEELKKERIGVYSLSPGWVKTDMGGDSATLTIDESVTKLVRVIENLDLKNSGKFLELNGKVLSW